MSDDAFIRALDIVLKSEGGYSDHKADRGGKTMYGITQSTFNMWLTKHASTLRPVQSITKSEMQQIYKQEYWTKASCQYMTENLAICHFDAAVNHGVSRAAKLLQKAVNVAEDGVIGQKTLDAVQSIPENIVIRAYLDARDDFFHQIVARDPSQSVFLKGWLNRLENLEKELGIA